MNSSLFVCQIYQKDNYTFVIEWNDGMIQTFRLSHLQRRCPCAHCIDENTGKRFVDPKMIDENVKAIRLRSVGRYGLRIQFTSGCSMGIYSFDQLRTIK